MHRPGWLVVLVLGGVAALRADASAQVNLVVIEPTSLGLDFGPLNIGVTSAPQRIRVRNTGNIPVRYPVYLQSGPLYQIVDSGGSLDAGDEAYWDIIAAPTLSDLTNAGTTQFVIQYGDDYYAEIDFTLSCQVRRAPFDPAAEIKIDLVVVVVAVLDDELRG